MGFLDRDGCPDDFGFGDRDLDGVPDNVDECPLSAETYNKFQDEDGCPDSVLVLTFIDTDNDGIQDKLDLCP